jgi:hypothetical protein
MIVCKFCGTHKMIQNRPGPDNEARVLAIKVIELKIRPGRIEEGKELWTMKPSYCPMCGRNLQFMFLLPE